MVDSIDPDGRIGSWSALLVPPGMPMRYRVCGDGQTISLILGGGAGQDELTIDLPVSKAAEVVVNLESAIKEIAQQQQAEDDREVQPAR